MIDIHFVFAFLLLELDSNFRWTSIASSLIVLPAVTPPNLLLRPAFLHSLSNFFDIMITTPPLAPFLGHLSGL